MAEDPLLVDYRLDVQQLLLQRGQSDDLGGGDELAIAACFDRGQLVSVCATRITASRRQILAHAAEGEI